MNPDEVIKEKFNKYAVSEQAGELLFRHEDALRVIEEIEKLQIIILGLDFWRSIDNDYMEVNSTAWDDINSGENASSLTVRAAKRLLKNGLQDNADFVSFILGIREKFSCPCCGFKTLEEEPRGTYAICPVCFWEDDLVQFDDPDYEGGANTVSLNQAKENFKKYGVSELQFKQFIRNPREDEK